jgi:chromosome segregation ATPase
MNVVGRIFTVLIFLMSVVFATFALAVYATQTNWKLAADNDKPPEVENKGLVQRLEKAKKESEELQGQKKKLEEQCKVEKERQDRALAALETENLRLVKDWAEDEQKLVTLERQLDDDVLALQRQHERLVKLRAETDDLRRQIAAAKTDREAQFKRLVALTDELHNAVAERMRLEKSNAELRAELNEARRLK